MTYITTIFSMFTLWYFVSLNGQQSLLPPHHSLKKGPGFGTEERRYGCRGHSWYPGIGPGTRQRKGREKGRVRTANRRQTDGRQKKGYRAGERVVMRIEPLARQKLH